MSCPRGLGKFFIVIQNKFPDTLYRVWPTRWKVFF